jgi:hypothetical protein
MDACAWNFDSGKFTAKFSATLCSRIAFHTSFAQKNAIEEHVEPCMHTIMAVFAVTELRASLNATEGLRRLF